jgi:hypothetical protein
MQQDLLQTVIEVEKEIQRHIEAEKNKAAAWLDDIKQSCRREIEETRTQLTESHTTSVDEACREAEAQALQRLALSECKTKALQNFPEDILEKIIVAELSLLLPDQAKETADDR